MILKSEGTYRHRHTHALRPGTQRILFGGSVAAGRVWSILMSRIAVKFSSYRAVSHATHKETARGNTPGICMYMYVQWVAGIKKTYH